MLHVGILVILDIPYKLLQPIQIDNDIHQALHNILSFDDTRCDKIAVSESGESSDEKCDLLRRFNQLLTI